MVNILFPGRHQILTKFQKKYLKNLAARGVGGEKVDKIIFAVTSANHENTRRNPIPLYLRTMAITIFAKDIGCEVKIYPIKDVPPTDRFAEYMIKQIFYQSGERLTKQNTILACSTPSVISMFKKMGFRNLPVELVSEKPEKYCALRPWEVVGMIAKDKKWKNGRWKEYADESSQEVYLEYNLGNLIIELFHDSLLTEDADITETRDYNTYASGMDNNVQFKFEDIKSFIKTGKIVDAGCGTGALVNLLAKNFPESDIIGIEATRKFYEYCRMQDYANPFVFFYRRNILDQNFKENTINTFIYSSILHEIYSYIGEKALKKLIKNTYIQLAHSGRIIIRDVVGPENPDEIVFMELNEKDGKAKGDLRELSTYSKFFRFVTDFKPRKVKFSEVTIENKKLIKIRLVDAYEFLSKMTYTDNWHSEMHEEFGFWSFKKWRKELEKAGFIIFEGSKEFKSSYIIDKMYFPRAKLYTLKAGKPSERNFPSTNMILVGKKI